MTVPNIALADAEAAPVTHTFTPIQDGPEAKWINSASATILSGQETLAVEIARGKTDTSPTKGRVVLWDPVEGTVDGKTVVLYGGSGSTNFNFAPEMTEQQKRNLVKMQANALLNADVVNALVKGAPFI